MKLMQGAVFRAVCLLFVVMLTAAGGCTFIKKITPGLSAEPRHKVKSVDFQSTDNVNQDTPVAVDLVFVHDAQLVETLSDVSARVWFTQKDAYLPRLSSALNVSHHELVPQDALTVTVGELELPPAPPPKKARAVLLFANYLTDSKAYTLDISDFQRPVVLLQETEITVEETSDKDN